MSEETFGRLTVIKEVPHEKSGRWLLLRCECGEFVRRAARDLRSIVKRGATPGCRRCSLESIALNGAKNRVHGYTVTHPRLYDVHRQMLRRCTDPASNDWPAYGGRGIRVCDAWLDVGAFITWAEASGYKQGLTIERKDVNGHYEPGNCEWIENRRQARNTRKVLRADVGGQRRVVADLAQDSGIPLTTVKGRLRRGWSVDDATTVAPVRGRNQTWRGQA